MATTNPDGTLSSSLAGLQGLLDKLIGSKTVGTDQRSLTTQQNTDNNVNTSSNDTTTGSVDTNQNTLQQLISALTSNTQQTTQSTADVGALKQVFAQQQGGLTPDMLASIFREGAKAAPQLVATTANALGARSGDNSAEASALRDLSTNLVSQAATLNQGMLRDSADTAGRIATATGGSTTTGTTTQNTNQNTSGSTQTTQDQNIQRLIQQLQQQTQNVNTGQQMRDDNTSTTGINTKQVAGAAGIAGLVSLLNSDAGKAAIGAGGDALTHLINGWATSPSGGGGDTGLFGNIFDDGKSTIPLPPGTGDYGGNPYTNGSTESPGFDWGGIFDGTSGGFADGGVVGQPKLLDINSNPKYGAPSTAQLLALLGAGGSSGGVNIASLLGGLTGGNGGTGNSPAIPGADSGDGASSGSGSSTSAPSSNDGFSSPVGPSMSAPTASQAIGIAMGLMGNPIGLIGSIASLIGNNFSLNSNISSINAPADVDLGPADPSAVSSMDTVSVDSVNGMDAASDAAASAAADGEGDSGAGSADGSIGADAGSSGDGDGDGGSGDGGSGDGGGDGGDGGGGDGGWANGGIIPKGKKDPAGVRDLININVSGGEGIIPTDVVQSIGPDFIHSLINLFHQPAATQDGAVRN